MRLLERVQHLLLRRLHLHHLRELVVKLPHHILLLEGNHVPTRLEARLLRRGPGRKVFLALLHWELFAGSITRRVIHLPKRVLLFRVARVVSFYAIANKSVSFFDLPIGLGMGYGCEVKFYAEPFTVVLELP